MSRNIYLVTSGEHKPKNGKLRNRGEKQAKKARDILLQRNLGEKSVILSSIVPRATETAEIIAKKSGSKIVKDPSVYDACAQPTGSLAEAIDPLLKLTPPESPRYGTVAIIVGTGFVKRALEDIPFFENTDVEPGQVWQYVPGKGLNPQPLQLELSK